MPPISYDTMDRLISEQLFPVQSKEHESHNIVNVNSNGVELKLKDLSKEEDVDGKTADVSELISENAPKLLLILNTILERLSHMSNLDQSMKDQPSHNRKTMDFSEFVRKTQKNTKLYK